MPRRVLAIAGLIIGGIASAVLITSYASPYWVETDKSVTPTGFERMGLWEACFHNYYPQDRPISQKRYEGCWPAISYDMRDLYDHFYPPWMRGVQVLVTLAMLMTVGSVIIIIVHLIHCCVGMLSRLLVLIAAILTLVSGVFLFICTIMFGVHVGQDVEWLPQPVFLSWAFGFAILAAILCLLVSFCLIADYIRLRREAKYMEDAPPPRQSARYYVPPPQYDKVNNGRVNTGTSQVNTGYSASHSDKNEDTPSVAPPRQFGRRSQPQYEEELNDRQDYSGRSTRHSKHQSHYDDDEEEEKVKVYDKRSDTARLSRHKPHHSYDDDDDDEEEKAEVYDKRSDKTRLSRHRPHHSDNDDDNDDRKTRDKRSDSSRRSRQKSRQSEAQYDDDAESYSKHSNSVHRSKPRSHHSEPRYEDERDTYDRRRDTASRHSGRRSSSQPRHEESKLYDRRSNSSSRPSRQNSHRSQSQSRYEGSRQRY